MSTVHFNERLFENLRRKTKRCPPECVSRALRGAKVERNVITIQKETWVLLPSAPDGGSQANVMTETANRWAPRSPRYLLHHTPWACSPRERLALTSTDLGHQADFCSLSSSEILKIHFSKEGKFSTEKFLKVSRKMGWKLLSDQLL